MRTIHRALDLGCDFFDTAESYGPFVNEELLDRPAIGGRRRGAGHAHLPRCRQSTTLRVASILRLAAARTQPRSFTHPPIAGRS
ncbi:hypothetical protein [Streptomyces atratus]|uniref:hypothetical protein n=1 Tax=Streptomyces atratus TaxID=1893 RepID=UPI0038734A15